MRRRQWSDDEVFRVLLEAERRQEPIRRLLARRGVPLRTFYNWRLLYGGMDERTLSHWRRIQTESQRLKFQLARQARDIRALKLLLREFSRRSHAGERPSPGRQREPA